MARRLGGRRRMRGYGSPVEVSAPPPVAAPSISAITPDFGTSAGGTAVTISGTGFTDATDATVGGITLDSFTVVSDIEITGTTNAVLEGDEDVVVTGPGGSDTLINGFEFVDPPDITSISPDFGSSAGGTAVTITGVDFTGATAASVGGVALASFLVVNDTTITGVTGAHAEADNTDVVVTGLVGNDTLSNAFDYFDPPTVTSVSDEVGGVTEGVGDTAGGVPVTINGTNFTGASGATIGGVAVTSFVVVSDIKITCVTGAHAAGLVDVAVQGIVPGGTALTNGYEYFNPTSITNLVWWLRADLGVTLNGSNVSAWADQSGSGDANRNVTKATANDQPPLNVADATYNNKNTIGTFNRSSPSDACRLSSAGAWSASYATFTMGVVGHAPTASNRYFLTGTSGSGAHALLNGGNQPRMFGASSASAIALGAGGMDSAKGVLIGRFNGASSALYVNATETPGNTGALTAVSLGASIIHVGSFPAGSSTFGVERVAEIFAWSRVLTTAEEVKLRKYLNGRYGKTMST